MVWLLHLIPCPGDGLIQYRKRAKVAISASGIADIPHTKGCRKVGFDFPGIAKVCADPVVRAKSAERKSESRLRCRKDVPVRKKEFISPVVQGTIHPRLTKAQRVGRREVADERLWTLEVNRKRGKREELCKSTALDVVVGITVPDYVRAPDLAAVILELMVALRRGLRSVRTWSSRKPVSELEANREIREGKVASVNRIQKLILELQVFEPDTVGE
jgi:hypothetical protein